MKLAHYGWLLPVFLLFSASALAGKVPAEASMVITGSVEIAPDGSVTGYQLDKASKLPSGVKSELVRTVPTWKFEPVLVNGKAVSAKSPMSVRLTAKPMDKGHYAINIGAAWFGQYDGSDHATISIRQRQPPPYPTALRRRHVEGVVYVAMRINRQGEVDKAAVQQIDLRTRGNQVQLRRWRKAFADASLRAAKKWTFNIPTTGKHAEDGHWLVSVPINYRLVGRLHSQRAGYGRWVAYIPGPKQLIPWLDDDQRQLSSNAAAMSGGGPHMIDQQLHLISPLAGGS